MVLAANGNLGFRYLCLLCAHGWVLCMAHATYDVTTIYTHTLITNWGQLQLSKCAVYCQCITSVCCQCIDNALLVYCPCITSVLPMHYQCIASELPMLYQCIARVLAMHYQCIARVLSMHYQCIARVLSMHYQCMPEYWQCITSVLAFKGQSNGNRLVTNCQHSLNTLAAH